MSGNGNVAFGTATSSVRFNPNRDHRLKFFIPMPIPERGVIVVEIVRAMQKLPDKDLPRLKLFIEDILRYNETMERDGRKIITGHKEKFTFKKAKAKLVKG